MRVLRGTLTETLFERAPSGHVKATFSRDLSEGSLIGSEDSDIHQVSNLQAENADLVTLHVYAPPLNRMETYSLFDSTRGYEVSGAGVKRCRRYLIKLPGETRSRSAPRESLSPGRPNPFSPSSRRARPAVGRYRQVLDPRVRWRRNTRILDGPHR